MKKQLDDYALKITEAQQAFSANSAARSEVGRHIAALAEQIKSVTAYIKEVQSISLQIKILSVNASVEAARAGQHGKGFAVVASEVGRLSKNTDTAVKNIEESIILMQKMLDNTVSDMAKAKVLGAEFDEKLSQCVEEAHKLTLLTNEND